MSDSAKKQLTAEEQQFLTSPAGYSQFVKGLASAPAGFKLPQTQVRLLIDQLQALNNASLALDHLKRVITYGDKPRMNPCPMYSGQVQGEEVLRINGDLIHGLLGKMTEALELAPVLLQLLTHGSYDPVNLVEELGDDEFYTDLVRQAIDRDRHHMITTNVNKLVDRYDGLTFDPEKALNRDLDSERQALEGSDRLGEDQ